MLLLSLGWSQTRISNALYITEKTLRKHYFPLLKTRAMQRDRLDAWRFETLAREAEKGNVGAMRELGRLVERNDQMYAAARISDAPAEAAPDTVGKKEAARRAALEATEGGSDLWGGDLTPGQYDS